MLETLGVDGRPQFNSPWKEPVRIVGTAGVLVLLIVIIRNAWVSDDAYITFRTIDNFVHGYGLRWNVDERVQSYTHPLWMFVIAAIDGAGGDPYYASIAASIVFAIGAVLVLVWHIATGWKAASVALLTLIFSKAFVDYSTSGLENPLTYFLLATFFAGYFRMPPSRRRVGLLALAAALLMTNRLDEGLLVLPALAAAFWAARRPWLPVMAGFLPLLAWEAFAVVYYGFPLPNTAYAKLPGNIPAADLMAQGVAYYRDSLTLDPLTLTAIGAVIVASVALRQRHVWAVTVGMSLYLAYVLRVGGDFMSGRFFSTPLFCAAIAMCRLDRVLTHRSTALASLAVVSLGMTASTPTVLSGASPPLVWIEPSGITDERLYYYHETGLLRTLNGASRRPPSVSDKPARSRRRPTIVMGAVGQAGFSAGPDVRIIDINALTDPLLARLPAKPHWRVGHYERDLPNGYQQTVESGLRRITDPAVAALYDRLWLVTSGPIWNRDRWRALVGLNFHHRWAAATIPSPLPTLVADFTVTPEMCTISGPSAVVDCFVDASPSDSVAPIMSYAWEYCGVTEADNMRMALRLTCANTGGAQASTVPVSLTVRNAEGASQTITRDVRVLKIGACGFP